ncbi:PKD domain-containing protein [Bernardetia sp. Wsw4-3y2]|uniref:PKD domain-containing protein n=1 Tax=Bernardetia sp. Wsw4-3y2 TaxID=3127471 RepID=UPI0030CCCF9B
MRINLPQVRNTIFLLFTTIICIVFFLLPIISIAQYLPDNFDSIKPLGNKLMIKIKPNSSNKLQQVDSQFKTQKLERRFKVPIQNSKNPSIKAIQANAIRLQDWYEVEISSSSSLQEAIHYYQNQDFVEYAEPIYPNYILAPPYIPNDPSMAAQWQLDVSQLYAAWGLHKGDSNTVIGIVDTGVHYIHRDLKNQIKVNYAEKYGQAGIDDDNNGFVDDSLGYSFGFMSPASHDFQGHGTGVAGMAAATTDDGLGIAGTSFNCRILPVAVLSPSYQIVNMYDGILYAAENGCKVINVSIGRPNLGFQWEQDVIDYVTLVKDALVVAAAGNTAQELDFYPSSYNHVLSVAHSDAGDNKFSGATFSNYVDVMAPGARVLTTTANGSYSYAWGSSYASPFVAGIAALVRSAFPHLSADQAGELVRVTSDNKYHLPANVPYFEKLGKGRVNAFRALNEQSSAKSIRMNNTSYFGRNGQTAFSGDTITLEADFINYLNPITQNGKVIISTSSPYIEILDSVFNTDMMATMQQKNNAAVPFRFVVSQNAPLDLNVKFRLGFSDTNYSDYQYFSIPVNAPYLAIPFNTINFTLTGNGRAGFYDIYNSLGKGIMSNNSQTLQEGGLIIGKSSTNVSDNVLTNIGGIVKDDDFKMIDIPRITEKTPFFTKATSKFADTLGTLIPPVGVSVKHTVKGRTNTPHHQYIILEYEFTNVSGAVMDSMNVGLYYDWNLGDYTRNFADWDTNRQFGYVFGTGTSGYAGIKAISSNKTYFALDFQNVGGNNINVNDGFTSTEKYQSISTGVARKRAGFTTSGGGDVAHIVGTVLENFGINETRKVTFVVMLAPTLAALRNAHDAAVLATNTLSSISPTPVVNNTLCENTSYTITPQGGTNFRLYDIANTQIPIQSGTSFTLTPADLGRTFYVTNTDSVLEGDYTLLRFSARTAVANFSSPSQVNLDEINAINFTDASQNAVSWMWDFGNGLTSNSQNPSTTYSRQGAYSVSLTITDIAGCTSTIEKQVQAVRKSPDPIVFTNSQQSCDNTPIEIRPSATGTNFKFYDSENRLLARGRSYIVPPKSIDSLYISNIDSALESNKVLVKIQWVKLDADFTANPRQDTLLYDNVLFQSSSTSDFFIQNITWDFGDGSLNKTGTIVSHMYAAQGSYTVKMTIRNQFGCTKVVEKIFHVGKKSLTPSIASTIKVCRGNSLTIRPNGGTIFNFYSNLDSLPISQGREISFAPNAILPPILYVTGADSLIESDPIQTYLQVVNIAPSFDFLRELYLNENTDVRFTDNTATAVSWLWDFGDGTTSTERNPIHTYHAQGDYMVTLTVKTAAGCQGTASKSLLVFRRSPQPIVNDLFVCRFDSTTIVPQGGTLFNFYDLPTSSRPVHTGRIYNVGFISQPKDIWVTNLDSALESVPVKVHIDFSRPSSDFEMSVTDTLNLFEQDTLFLKDKSNSSVWWYWNFGNGEIAMTQNTQTIYKQQGEYQVILITRDTLGCIDSLSRNLVVVDKPVITGGGSNTNYQVLVYPNPASDYLNAYIELQTSDEVMIRIYNSLGQELITSPKEQITKKRFVFDVRRLTKGVYYVQIVMSDKVVNRKVVLE